MAMYRITLQRVQSGRKLDWTKSFDIELSSPPKIGDGHALLVDPPIYETVEKFEKLT
jgi:hypothetical protein